MRRRFRLTVGRMMIVVAVAALVLGGGIAWRRKAVHCREMARFHAREEKGYRSRAAQYDRYRAFLGKREVEWTGKASAERTPEKRRSLMNFARTFEMTPERDARIRESKAKALRRAEWFGRVRQGYERAAWFPWFPTPEEPEGPPEGD